MDRPPLFPFGRTYTGPFLISPFHAVMTKEQERRDDGCVPKSHTYRRSSVEPLLHNFQLYFRAGRAVNERAAEEEGGRRSPRCKFRFFFSGAVATTTLTRVANSDEQFLKGSDRSSPKLHSQVSLSVKPRGLLLLLSPTLQPTPNFLFPRRPSKFVKSGADGGDRQARRGPRMEKGWRKRNVIFSEQEATCKWENMRYGVN